MRFGLARVKYALRTNKSGATMAPIIKACWGVRTGMALLYDLFHASDLTAHQTDLDAVRMRRRSGQDVFDGALGQPAGGLILLQNDQHGHAGLDVGAGCAIHVFAIEFQSYHFWNTEAV